MIAVDCRGALKHRLSLPCNFELTFGSSAILVFYVYHQS